MDHDKDAQQIRSARNVHNKRRHRNIKQPVEAREAGARKSEKDATLSPEADPYDEEARKKEKEIVTAVAEAVLVDLDIDSDGDKKPKKRKRKSAIENGRKKDRKERDRSSTGASRITIRDKAEDFSEKEKHERKEGKKKKASSDNDVYAIRASPVPDSDGQMPKPKTKRKEKDVITAASSVTTSATDTTAALESSDKKEKESKKRKHAESLPADGDPASTPDTAGEKSQRPKKKKRSLKMIDPTKDESLSEPALKALSYAFFQYEHPTEWKFNKARQNWLIRNIWSPAMIPDEHLPLLIWYLKNIKGGVRDTLIKICRTHLQSDVQIDNRQVTDGQTELETTRAPLFGLSPEVLIKSSDKAQEIKKSRAEAVMEVLEAR
ncbi:hypothetical protein AX15_002582 [Amanita polypyramis BW_CC]|nr:hypothetical protein AX15_002582 [Amanita polypyramis BW_CC]